MRDRTIARFAELLCQTAELSPTDTRALTAECYQLLYQRASKRKAAGEVVPEVLYRILTAREALAEAAIH